MWPVRVGRWCGWSGRLARFTGRVPDRVCSPSARLPAEFVRRGPKRRTCGLGARCAPLAQSAERLHGKEKVYGSIP